MNAALEAVVNQMVQGWQNPSSLPKSRETVGDCLALTLFALLDEYMNHDSALAREVDALIAAAFNRNDPLMRTMGQTEVMTVHSVLNLLRQQRKLLHAQVQEESAPGSSGTPSR